MVVRSPRRLGICDYVADISHTERTLICGLFDHLDPAQTDTLLGRLSNCRMLLGWMIETQQAKREPHTVAVHAALCGLTARYFDLTIEAQLSLYDRLMLAVVDELTKFAQKDTNATALCTAAMALMRNCARRWDSVPSS